MRSVSIVVVCILDSKVGDNYILPERAHSLYFNAPPAPLVKECLREDMKQIFAHCEIEEPTLIQAHGLDHYALVVRIGLDAARVSEDVSKEGVPKWVGSSPHVLVASEEMNSTFDIEKVRKRLAAVGMDTPPIAVFPNSVTVERLNGEITVKIEAAVRYSEISPLTCIDAIRMIRQRS